MVVNNIYVAALMYKNGWPVLPVVPGEKKPLGGWVNVDKEHYDFGRLFDRAPLNCNIGILTQDITAVVDLDVKDRPEPNGLTLYNFLVKTYPGIFDNCIVERTQSNGFHIYFQGIPEKSTYKVPITMDGGIIENAEILCARKFSFCAPSVGPAGTYRLISERTFLNTRPEELPELPAIFARPPPVEPARVFVPRRLEKEEKLSPEDLEVSIQYYVDKPDYAGANAHEKCCVMARCLAGLGLPVKDIERLVEHRIKREGNEGHGRGLSDDGEAERIARYGMQKPIRDAIPWEAVMKARRERGYKYLTGDKQ